MVSKGPGYDSRWPTNISSFCIFLKKAGERERIHENLAVKRERVDCYYYPQCVW